LHVVLAINKGDVKDTEIEAIMDCIVDSLFSVFVTLGELIGSYCCHFTNMLQLLPVVTLITGAALN